MKKKTRVMAFNGSARKHHNTAALLGQALDGAQRAGGLIELIHLHDHGFTGCTSCFACKRKNSPSYGRCALQDDLTPILERAYNADVLILGSPIYFSTESGVMRNFMERLWFPYLTYSDPPESLYPRKINTALIYTMNCPEEKLGEYGYRNYFENMRGIMVRIFGHCEMIYAEDTYQFKRYDEYVCPRFDPRAKLQHHNEVFLKKTCPSAWELGKRLVKGCG